MNEYKIDIPHHTFSEPSNKILRLELIYNAEFKGLFPKGCRDKYLQRIDQEIEVFERCGCIDYLLGILTLMIAMRRMGIPYIAGCGVYSASLVLYLIGVTNVDPIEHDLMFARFMPADKPKFIELELLIGYVDKGLIKQLERRIMRGGRACKHSVKLICSPVVELINKTVQKIGFHKRSRLFDWGNTCFLNEAFRDDNVYDFLSMNIGERKSMAGVFGFEICGCKNVIFKDNGSFGDLVRLCAINRPGSYEMFCDNDSRYCFQEEIMRDAIDCGFSEAEADDLRRAVGRKQTEKLELYRHRWIVKYGEASWQTMTEQGLWSYPKAHAIVLAYLAYITAYLKLHFPEEYTRAALCVAASVDY